MSHELTGTRYGRWTVLARSPIRHQRNRWRCACDCGTVRVVAGRDLLSGASRSCGCRLGERHGGAGTPMYTRWFNLRRRGALCARWGRYSRFAQDLGPQPRPGWHIYRPDPSTPYGPGNAGWAPPGAKGAARAWVELEGVRKSVVEWCAQFGMPANRYWGRIGLGWTPEQALRLPRGAQPNRPGAGVTCRRGHPWTPESEYRRPGTGKRFCRICRREKARSNQGRKSNT